MAKNTKADAEEEKIGTQTQDISKVLVRNVENEMITSYINYSMSVIVGRALPDVRDGLKPVHRRILYSMKELGLSYNKTFKKAARIVGECFVKGTLVSTAKGLAAIEDVRLGDSVYTRSGLRKVSRLYVMPEKDIYRIVLKNGLSNAVTASQKFCVLDGNLRMVWKEAKKITKKDFVVVKAPCPDNNKNIRLGTLSGKTIYLNENVAYLLGQLVSDGWVEKGYNHGKGFRLGFGSSTLPIIKRLRKILKDEFKYAATTEIRTFSGAGKLYTLRINKVNINDFLISSFGLRGVSAATKFIPPQIFVSPKKVVFSFISGLIDGDGSAHKKRNCIHYGSVSEQLIGGLQTLLTNFGVMGERFTEPGRTGGVINGKDVKGRQLFHSLEIRSRYACLLASLLNVSQKSKAENLKRIKLNKVKTAGYDAIPNAGRLIFKELSKKHLGGGWYCDESGNKFRMGVKYPAGCKIRYSKNLPEKNIGRKQILDWRIFDKLKKINSPLSEILEGFIKNELYFIKVEKVEKCGREKTFDLQVEKEHEFIANGMLSHNCLGKYHPHGDLSVYDAIIRMAQDFSLRYPLVRGQGNVGSIDGDPPAAMRYVEAKLERIADEMLKDLDKGTVDFTDNFDATLQEPVVMPSNFPNLLVNGSEGIAVGMATKIPPHNLSEVVGAAIALIDNPELSDAELFKLVPAPDFPTGAIITNRSGIQQAYKTGRGTFKIKARAEIEQVKGGREIIVITELPYQVNKARLIENIAILVREKKITGITNLRDESDKDGIRVVVDVSRDAVGGVVLNQLFKHTQLSVSFGIILLSLVNNVPKVLSLRQMLGYYIDHRIDVITRRTKFDLAKAEARAHILEGLRIALENLDRIIKTIKESDSPAAAKDALVKKFKMSELQAQAILDMKLHQLTGLERIKVEEEYIEKIKLIEKLKKILSDTGEILAIIKEDLEEVRKKYGDKRLTEISDEDTEIADEDLISDTEVALTITHQGYIKRVPLSTWRVQGRGGKGVNSMKTKDEDYLEHLFVTSNLATFLVFTNLGKLYWLKVWKIPEANRTSQGKALVNFLAFKTASEKFNSFCQIRNLSDACGTLLMVSEKGLIKKTPVAAYSHPRSSGIIAINLKEGDKLVKVLPAEAKSEVVIATKLGKAIRFSETTVRSVGRSASGVRGIRLGAGDSVVGMIVQEPSSKESVLVISEKGYGKRTDILAYRKQSRGGKGVINMKINDKTGPVVAIFSCSADDDIMIITTTGVTIRQKVKDIRQIGRATSGVRLIKLGEGDRVASAGKIISDEEIEV